MNLELLELDHLDDSERVQLIKDCALELFEGNQGSSDRWLNSPLPIFNSRTPLEYANTTEAVKEVLALIGRMEHGVFS